MKSIIAYFIVCSLLLACCAARAVIAPGTFGAELFAIPAVFVWGVSLIRKVEE